MCTCENVRTREHNCRPVCECIRSGSHGTGVKAYIYTGSTFNTSVLNTISELPLPLPASLLMPLGWISPLFIQFEKASNVFLTLLHSPPERPPAGYDFDEIMPLTCLFFLPFSFLLADTTVADVFSVVQMLPKRQI